MQAENIDPLKDATWDRLVMESDLGSIFHLASWKEVISKTFGGEPFYFALRGENGSIQAGLPFFFIKSRLTGKRLVSLPLASFCDPLIKNASALEELLRAVMEKSIELNASYIEIKTLNEFNLLKEKNFKCYRHYNTHVMPLGADLDVVEKCFHTNVKRCLKKAKCSNVTVREATKSEEVKLFFNLHVLTRKKHGLLSQPFSFFKNMWEILCQKGLCSLLLASCHDRTIAAAFFLKFKDTFYYEYGASDERFNELYPNHILLWEAIKSAHKEKFRFFDFGRSSVENEGLNIFKRKWGGNVKELYYYYYPDIGGAALAKTKGDKYSLIKHVNRHMPSSIMKIMGDSFYKSFI